MPIQIRDADAWKDVIGVQVRDGGAWKSVTDAWIRDGGIWKSLGIGIRNLRVSSRLQNQLTFNWDAVAGVTNYQYRLGATGAVQTTSATTVTIRGLQARTGYTFYVRVPGGEWYSVGTSTRQRLATPSRPVLVSRTRTTITVSYAAVALAGMYRVITGVTGSGTASGYDTSALQYTVTRLTATQPLTPNTSYDITLRIIPSNPNVYLPSNPSSVLSLIHI